MVPRLLGAGAHWWRTISLLSLPEIKREEILSKRAEEMQKELERRNIERMVKSQAAGGSAAMDVDSVSKAAKRAHVSHLFPEPFADAYRSR